MVPVPTSQHGVSVVILTVNLQKAKFVLIRHDANQIPLQRPYERTFKVTESSFKVDIGGETETFINNRLKSAYLDSRLSY